jgi:hypothetical protein
MELPSRTTRLLQHQFLAAGAVARNRPPFLELTGVRRSRR